MSRTLIVYPSDTDPTGELVNLIAAELRSFNIDTKICCAEEVQSTHDLNRYDALVFGSASYHREDMKRLRNLLAVAARADLTDKVGGSFGSANWYGDTPDQILFDTMADIFGMDMLSAPLKLQGDLLEDDNYSVRNWACELAQKLSAREAYKKRCTLPDQHAACFYQEATPPPGLLKYIEDLQLCYHDEMETKRI